MSLKPRYVPDLNNLGSLCQANYVRLLRLLPDGTPVREFLLPAGPEHRRVRLQIDEDHRYTTLLTVIQDGGDTPWLQPQSMQVRMYHDARMAEVTGYQHRQRFDGRYGYPNPDMHQPDEKEQINRFLAEWLSHCLRYGQTPQPDILRMPE